MKKFPTFIFRSVLGKELHRQSCILLKQDCLQCPVNNFCVYSKIFFSPVVSNEAFKGNKKPHPFTIFVDLPVREKVKECKLKILLIGNDYNYLPFLYMALIKAGEKGIFRERIKFFIKDVLFEGKKINPNEQIFEKYPPLLWEINSDINCKNRESKKIDLLTPVKIQRNKKLVRNLTYKELIKNGMRRLKLLTLFYGEGEDFFINLDFLTDSISKEERELSVVSLRYRSFRQKKTIPMSGVRGFIEVEKQFSPMEESLLTGMEIFGVGKATSFGFGRIKIGRQT